MLLKDFAGRNEACNVARPDADSGARTSCLTACSAEPRENLCAASRSKAVLVEPDFEAIVEEGSLNIGGTACTSKCRSDGKMTFGPQVMIVPGMHVGRGCPMQALEFGTHCPGKLNL